MQTSPRTLDGNHRFGQYCTCRNITRGDKTLARDRGSIRFACGWLFAPVPQRRFDLRQHFIHVKRPVDGHA
jgi:hypothetical protein